MTLEELEVELDALTDDEKVQVIQILVDSLPEKCPGIDRAIQLLEKSLTESWSGITKTPGVMGGDACIKNTRIPVWLLVYYRRLGASDMDLLQDYPDLKAADLVNAFNYADANPDEIEKAIREQYGA